MASGFGHRDALAQALLRESQVLEGLSHSAERSAVGPRDRLGALETPGQFVGLGEDLIDSSGHGHHLMNFGRAGRMAWTITATPSTATTKSTSVNEPARSGPVTNVSPSSSSKTWSGLRKAWRMSSSATPCSRALT